ncbi:MAG: hypothetical protein EB051_01255, partial [Chlamydiia bacterium]|nr:hypothetical protein [Chlamydiia bacterium]
KQLSQALLALLFLKLISFSDLCVKMLRTYKNYRFYRKGDSLLFSNKSFKFSTLHGGFHRENNTSFSL